MNILILLRMLIFSASGTAGQPSRGGTSRSLFWAVIVPLSLLAPTMLLLLDRTPDAYLAVMQIRPSADAASLLFGCEVFSVLVMGWLIKQVANSLGQDVAAADAYLVAAIAPIPLWLSSLGLLMNNPLLNTLLPLSALVSCCVLIYQGAHSLCHVGDRLTAAAVTQAAFGAGLMLWVLSLPLFWAFTG